MKNHTSASEFLSVAGLNLIERKATAWTGGLTTSITYNAVDAEGNVHAEASFQWNRHPAFYKKQGLAARAGTERYRALDSIAAQIKKRLA